MTNTPNTTPTVSPCGTCNGDGVYRDRNIALGTFKVIVCPTCAGSGR